MASWGSRWTQQQLLCRCDNMVVVHLLHTRSSKDHIIMHLLRSLHFFLARWDIRLSATHIPGKFNVLSDALSCNHLQVFHHQALATNSEGTEIPQFLHEMLITTASGNRIKKLLENGIASSNRKVHNMATNAYLRFCTRLHRPTSSVGIYSYPVCCRTTPNQGYYIHT